jgi:hypothetical protein
MQLEDILPAITSLLCLLLLTIPLIGVIAWLIRATKRGLVNSNNAIRQVEEGLILSRRSVEIGEESLRMQETALKQQEEIIRLLRELCNRPIPGAYKATEP